ncbi:MAG TPA: hypothetical protein DCP64_09320, partial [Sarcina sp.]|nr:hypothetical protein [Sarcina sp.]
TRTDRETKQIGKSINRKTEQIGRQAGRTGQDSIHTFFSRNIYRKEVPVQPALVYRMNQPAECR